MKRPIILCLCVIACFLTAFGQKTKDKKVTKIKGAVVAEYRELAHACYHVCGLTLLLKLDKSSPIRFAVIRVEYMDDHSMSRYGMPVQLVEKASRWEFEAILEDGKAMPLQEYMKFIDQNGKDVSQEMATSAWDLLRGAENEKLPYGEPLATYRVSVGKFKSIK